MRSGRREGVGDGEQHRDGRGRADARQNADQRAEQNAYETIKQIYGIECGRETEREIGDEVHRRSLRTAATDP